MFVVSPVSGLSVVVVNSFVDVQRQLDVGGRNRSTAATNMNEHSSRSHAIVALRVVQVRAAILNHIYQYYAGMFC